MSFVSQILEPGGGVMLLPFVRWILILLLLFVVLPLAIYDVARIHMIILAFLATGLLGSLTLFESEFKKQQRGRRSTGATTTASSGSTVNKTD